MNGGIDTLPNNASFTALAEISLDKSVRLPRFFVQEEQTNPRGQLAVSSPKNRCEKAVLDQTRMPLVSFRQPKKCLNDPRAPCTICFGIEASISLRTASNFCLAVSSRTRQLDAYIQLQTLNGSINGLVTESSFRFCS
jgi:hypothetical protein